jgi:transposase
MSPGSIPAIYMEPFVKGQKNDYDDAEAIAEAAMRPNLRQMRPHAPHIVGRGGRNPERRAVNLGVVFVKQGDGRR